MFRRRRSADDFADEIKSHLELEADELQSEGLSKDEAHRRARVEFGNVDTAQELCLAKIPSGISYQQPPPVLTVKSSCG